MALLNLNERALQVADQLATMSTVFTVAGARVIEAPPNLEAGLLVARICLADLAAVSLAPGSVHGIGLPLVCVSVRQPVAACMASQYAGWQVSVGTYFAMGSGPMRAAYGKEELFDHIGCREKPAVAVGVLETAKTPNGEVVAYLAQRCGVAAEKLTLVTAPTASLPGGVQVAARSVETALHKLHALKFDLSRVVAGYGTAPLPPVARDYLAAIGRTNDAVLYGSEVTLYCTGDDQTLTAVGEKLPACASRDYGRPFAEVFAHYHHDFYKIDPMLFSPARVSLQNIQTGRTHTFGKVDHDVLARSFFP